MPAALDRWGLQAPIRHKSHQAKSRANRGANIEARNAHKVEGIHPPKITRLQLAIANGHDKVVVLLTNHGGKKSFSKFTAVLALPLPCCFSFLTYYQ